MEQLDWDIESRVLLIDGNNLFFRTYFGIKQDLKSNGILIHAVFGFLRSIQMVYKRYNIDYVISCFDSSKSKHRLEIFPEYKAQRKKESQVLPEQEENLWQQLNIITDELLPAMNIPIVKVKDHEADDIIGSLAHKLCEEHKVYILSGDLDFTQLVSDKIFVIKPGMRQKKDVVYTPVVFREIFEFEPVNMIDLKCLTGDPSDNIPGVRGIGEVRGKELIKHYASIERVYSELDNMTFGIRSKLLESREIVERNKLLVKILTDLQVEIPKLSMLKLDSESMKNFYRKYEFESYLDQEQD